MYLCLHKVSTCAFPGEVSVWEFQSETVSLEIRLKISYPSLVFSDRIMDKDRWNF
jgi:hypothetical protein